MRLPIVASLHILAMALIVAACGGQDVAGPDADAGPDAGPGEASVWRVVLEDAVSYPATEPAQFARHLIVALPGIWFNAGDQGVLRARARVKGPATLNQPVLVAARIACGLESDATAIGVWTQVNWKGPSGDPDGVDVEVRDTFTAPSDGSFRCMLELLSGAGTIPDGTTMTALPGAGVTELELTAVVSSGVLRWSQPAKPAIEIAPGATLKILERSFVAADGLASVAVLSDVQLSACVPTSDIRGWCVVAGSAADSHVTSRLHVIQLADDGITACATSRFPETQAATQWISNVAHHAKLFHELVVEVAPGCSRSFVSWVDVAVSSGNPVKVEHGTPSGPLSVGGVSGPAVAHSSR